MNGTLITLQDTNSVTFLFIDINRSVEYYIYSVRAHHKLLSSLHQACHHFTFYSLRVPSYGYKIRYVVDIAHGEGLGSNKVVEAERSERYRDGD